MLSFIGLGLYGYDMSIEALKEAKKCDKLYAEFYTSNIGTEIEELEKLIGKKIIILDREQIEDGKELLKEAKVKRIGLLVGGDPMAATTHVGLRLQAMEMGIKTKILYGISVVTASASFLGLQIYKFGKVASIARPYEDYFPLSPYDIIKDNLSMGMHTLVLLDLYKEPMNANEAMEILIEMEKRRKEGIIKDNLLIAVVRMSFKKEMAKAGYIKDMINEDFGPPLHSLVIPGKLHFMEAKALIKIANAPKEILK